MVRESGSCVDVEKKGVQIAQYEIGRTLGEGNFGKVKQAKNLITGKEYAVKILDKKKILAISIDDQVCLDNPSSIPTFFSIMHSLVCIFFVNVLSVLSVSD